MTLNTMLVMYPITPIVRKVRAVRTRALEIILYTVRHRSRRCGLIGMLWEWVAYKWLLELISAVVILFYCSVEHTWGKRGTHARHGVKIRLNVERVTMSAVLSR